RLGAQGTVCGGGRYDDLFQLLGGKPSPATGFAIGIERLLELWLQDQDMAAPPECQVYLVHRGDEAQRRAMQIAEALRDYGLQVIVHAGSGGFRSQFRRADASGAVAAVVLGPDELAAGQASVKWLRAAEADQQESIALTDLADYLKGRM
ncbi:MAG TPA: His/Gly/Thr/Pro-type tRNA ligase C-terminal domain-containing protein, partial [Burkholderiaceae bacterium]|nr:His/Gly/Thr/Pro-type tRNA ligase C-terminal domain-containing protein [Burkholderiaceae bacterium]